MAAGAQHRFGCAPPVADAVEFAEFDCHTTMYISSTFTPLHTPSDDLEEWLEASQYSETDKEKLRKTWYLFSHEGYKTRMTCGAFCKDEFYMEMKPARSINARHDLLKCMLGPLVQAIEKDVFMHPSFIKKIPMNERPKYILAIMASILPIIVEGDDGLLKGMASDYSAFESLFTLDLIRACERKLIVYMLGGGKVAQKFANIIDTVCYGTNRNRYSSGLKVSVEAKRMSGEMFTSLGNGITNLLVLVFLFNKYVSKGIKITPAHFEALGLRAKLEHHDDPSEASFCGMVFDPVDQQIIRDPRATLVKLGWSRMPYVQSSTKTLTKLLRLKALSLAYESESCPVLSAIARRLLFLTKPAVKYDSWLLKYCTRWEKEWMIDNEKKALTWPEIGQGTRSLFAKLYGISVADQLAAERIAETMELGPAPLALLELLDLPLTLREFWDVYVSPSPNAGVGWATHGGDPACAGKAQPVAQ